MLMMIRHSCVFYCISIYSTSFSYYEHVKFGWNYEGLLFCTSTIRGTENRETIISDKDTIPEVRGFITVITNNEGILPWCSAPEACLCRRLMTYG